MRLVIVQAVNPPPGYPPGVTHQQLDTLIAHGKMAIDAYVYLWHGALGVTERNARLLDGYQPWLRNYWLDVEDAGHAGSVRQNCDDVNTGMALLDMLSGHAHDRCGIYTGAWYWQPFMGDWTAYSDHPLWTADYDGVPDPTVFHRYGGWTECAVKQFKGTSVFEGVGGVDINVVA